MMSTSMCPKILLNWLVELGDGHPGKDRKRDVRRPGAICSKRPFETGHAARRRLRRLYVRFGANNLGTWNSLPQR